MRLAEEVRSTVAARVEAGKVSPIEETRAEVALAAERIERDRAAAELQAVRSRLAATWGSSIARFERVVGDLDAMPPVPSLDAVTAAVDRNPEIARWAAEIVEREAALRIERARVIPDVTVGGGYRHFELGTGAAVVTASVPLPFFDRNRGAQIEFFNLTLRQTEEQEGVRLERLDLIDIHCQMAKSEGVLVALNSDGHSLLDFDNLRYGIGQARRGWLEAKDVLNTRTLKQLLPLLKKTM